LDKFITLYGPEQIQWDSIANLSASFEWEYLTAQTMAEYLDSQSISRQFTRELVEAATRVNYGQVSFFHHCIVEPTWLIYRWTHRT
jgi:prenylcysteine oxidase / farnesylcysteine lyase